MGSQRRLTLIGLLLLALLPRLCLGAPQERWKELNAQVEALFKQGKYAEALPVAQQALRLAEENFGREHVHTATVLNNLANVYLRQGKYAEAEPLYQRAFTIREKELGVEHPEVASSLDGLAILYAEQGKYAEAEPLFQRALTIKEKALGPEHPDVARSLNNLAGLYMYRGKYAEAEPLLQRALTIKEKALGPEHPHVADSLNNLALLYQAQGEYAQAEPLFQRALTIKEKVLGPEHPDVAGSLNKLAVLYRDQGKYAEAEPFFQRSLTIREKALGPEHPHMADSLGNLALLYVEQGKYTEAEPLYQRTLAILEKALGPENPYTGQSLRAFAQLYYAQQQPARAEAFFERSLQNLAQQFDYHFGYMSERERLLFLDKVAEAFPLYLSFCFTYREEMPVLAGRMYDLALWQKGLVATSIAALRAQVAASGDREALAVLEKLVGTKSQLARLLTAEPRDRAAWRKAVKQLRQESNELERELVRGSAALAEQKRLARPTWRQVQSALRKEEAAVEFLRFRLHDGQRWTDKHHYVALVLTPKSKEAPRLVELGEAERLEGGPLADYRARVVPAPTPAALARTGFYEAFWKPLEPALNGARRIYLSPDGVLNQVSWGVVLGKKERLLMEQYELRLVSSTKDLLRERHSGPAMNSAVLVGNPQFDLEAARQLALAQALAKGEEPRLLAALNPARGLRSQEQRGTALDPVPGTRAELEAIRALLDQRGWRVQVYSEERALEEAVKRVQQPRVLHLATHGFFFSDQSAPRRGPVGELPSGLEDPMLRSGLYFAGANRARLGVAAPAELEDGVLTAYEAMGLNLQGTELVVLSACQTGLGQVKNGEGVFGLRRALEVAGAEAVLMSLWSVPDRETQELMALFYERWLAGKDKHEALQEAQSEMRARVRQRYG